MPPLHPVPHMAAFAYGGLTATTTWEGTSEAHYLFFSAFFFFFPLDSISSKKVLGEETLISRLDQRK